MQCSAPGQSCKGTELGVKLSSSRNRVHGLALHEAIGWSLRGTAQRPRRIEVDVSNPKSRTVLEHEVVLHFAVRRADVGMRIVNVPRRRTISASTGDRNAGRETIVRVWAQTVGVGDSHV